MSEWLSDNEIRAIGTKHGKRDGKHDAGDVGMLSATVEKVRKNLARHDGDVQLREKAYLVAYVLAWGKGHGKSRWHIENHETLAGTISPVWVRNEN